MSQRQRGLRQEVSVLLSVDPVSLEFITEILPPPTERIANHLGNLITHATNHHDESRIVYSYLPALMFRMFGYEVGQGWLETCSEYPSRDREAIVALVLPDGPIHKFCTKHSEAYAEDISNASDALRYEFPRNNLPSSTNNALNSDFSSQSTVSYLAPLLAPGLRDQEDSTILLSPLDYFFVCMLASPAQKCVASRYSNPTAKVPKRSRSLPSVRAQYNQIFAAYAARLKASAPVDMEKIFIAACLDFLFTPWAFVKHQDPPEFSTSTADAVASLLITLAPKTPEGLDLESSPDTLSSGTHADLKLMSNSAALYRHTGRMLEGVFSNFSSSVPLFPLVAYVRVLAVYIAPWRGGVHAAVKAMLFPKQRYLSATAAARSPSMSALSSTLSSINAHLPSPTGSPTNVSATKERKWRLELRGRQQREDKELLRQVVILAANHRLAATADGCKVLAILGEAAYAAKLSAVPGSKTSHEDMEEVQLCLCALRDQKSQMERKSPRKEKDFVSLLAAAMGVKVNRGSMLSGFTDIVHAGSANGVAGMVNIVSNARLSTPTSLSKRRQQEKRTSAICGMQVNDIPFLGSIWDRPIAHGENETLVLFAYWLALRLEPVLGYVPDTRLLGHYWVWVTTTLVCAICVGINRLFFSTST